MARPSKARQEIADYQDDIKAYGLADPVTAVQLRQLKRCGYRGPSVSTSYQAKQIIARTKRGKTDGAT